MKELRKNMKKKMYIQPKMEVDSIHTEMIMLPVSPGINQNAQYNPAPQRHAPEMPTDTVAVF